MSTHNAIADLEKRIDRFYEAHSAKRVAMAALFVGAVSMGGTWVAYYYTLNVFIATGVFAGLVCWWSILRCLGSFRRLSSWLLRRG